MMKKVKNIVVVLLSVNILLSSMGMNLFIHTCKAADIIEYSLFHHNSDNGFDCPYCSDSEIEHSCNMNETEKNSCCANEEKEKSDTFSYGLEDCCNESSEFIKVIVESNALPEINIDFHSFVIEEQIFEIISLFESPVNSLEFLKHYSGISPPYESNYIHYISSILE